ncbi:Tigger transposable element-derived protein 1 [Anthophora plagiata]
MFEKIAGEEKQSIREFWKNYNIMNAVENINLSWNEITERSLKGVWKNIWPDLSKSEDIGHSVDMDEIVEEIVELAKQTGLDEVNVEDVEEIVQQTAAGLSNDELKELTEQEENKNIDSSDFEEEQKELSMAFVKRSLTTITEIMDQFVENVGNDCLWTGRFSKTPCKRNIQSTVREVSRIFLCYQVRTNESSKARRGVIDALSTYQQLLTERKRKTQTTLDAFLTKRQKIGNTK